jgi:hypothetical protein
LNNRSIASLAGKGCEESEGDPRCDEASDPAQKKDRNVHPKIVVVDVYPVLVSLWHADESLVKDQADPN